MPSNQPAQVKMTVEARAVPSTRDEAMIGSKLRNESMVNQVASVRRQESHLINDTPFEAASADPASEPVAVKIAHPTAVYFVVKRLFDFSVGLILLIIAVPIILAAAIAIRINTPGSPFFFQTRLGQDGKPFRIFKLRGMYIDARVRFPSFYDFSKKQDLEFCFHHEDDPRVTRAGRFIRKTSIDELPNLWNVVTGDLSLVGPRPEIPEVLALYGSYRDEYLSVKPGVTCLSKCTGRDRLTKRETIEFDLQYIRQRSFTYDCQILWRTFRSVVLRRDVF